MAHTYLGVTAAAENNSTSYSSFGPASAPRRRTKIQRNFVERCSAATLKSQPAKRGAFMAYVYVSDDAPESEDYDSNYFYFDETNRPAVTMIEKMLTSNAERDAKFREALQTICRNSLNRPDNITNVERTGYHSGHQWIKAFSQWARRIAFGSKPNYSVN
jgi:hypothetical protein